MNKQATMIVKNSVHGLELTGAAHFICGNDVVTRSDVAKCIDGAVRQNSEIGLHIPLRSDVTDAIWRLHFGIARDYPFHDSNNRNNNVMRVPVTTVLRNSRTFAAVIVLPNIVKQHIKQHGWTDVWAAYLKLIGFAPRRA